MNKKIYLGLFLSFFIINFSNAQLTLSGKVLRHNGEPLGGVTLNCTNAPSVISAADGSFSFSDLPEGGDYSITGDFETSFHEDVTVLDLMVVNDHILGIEFFEFSAPQWEAGEMNNNGSISALDMVLINRAIIRLENNTPDDYWAFFNEDPTSGLLTIGITVENLIEDIVNLELIAVKDGDAALKNDHFPPPADAPNTSYYIEDESVSQDQEFTVNIRVNDFNSIAAFQHGLHWDSNSIEYLAFENNTEFDMNGNEMLVDEGIFLIAGGKFGYFVDLEEDEVLYSLQFKALEDINTLMEVISFSSDLIPLETVYRKNTGDYGLFLLDDNYENVPTGLATISSLKEFEISPNPASDDVLVNINFDQVESGSLSLCDITGKLINSWDFLGQTLQETIKIQNLSKGIYILKLRTNNGMMTKGLVKQ